LHKVKTRLVLIN